MASINWNSHGQALQNHLSLLLHFSKLVHDILPTAAQLNKMDRGKRECPCCSHKKENREHIIRCPHPAWNKWRHELLTAIHNTCITRFTYTPLRGLLEDTMRAWMYFDESTAPIFQVQEFQYAQELRLLIRQQNNIGWSQLFQGRFSTEWSRLQGDHYYRTRAERPGQNHKFTGDGWQICIITLLWKHWRVLWKQRNNDVHGHDASASVQAEKRDVKRQLEQIYKARSQLEPSVQSLLHRDIHQHLQQPSWVVKNWLNINTPLFQTSIRRARKNATRGMRSIRTYFGAG
jgi:hypothetical protein